MNYYESKYGVLYKGDCLEVMKYIPDSSIDLVLCDPPYGCLDPTQCKWDVVIPLDKMWGALNGVMKRNSAACIFGSEPFSSLLRVSNIHNFKYDWVWKKSKATGHLNAKKRPLLKHEVVSVFNTLRYNPQGLIPLEKPIFSKGDRGKKGRGSSGECYGLAEKDVFRKETNYPLSIIEFRVEQKPLHPTQKPVELMEYLIKTYTNIGDTVLDFTIGSGTTAVAAINTGRKFIGIEMKEDYCEIAKQRIIEAEKKQEDLFGDI